MSRRHEQVAHRRKLSEIRNIMNSMKTLAIMETHKLERSITNQSVITASIENMAVDFLHFNPQVLPTVEPISKTVVLIGSERGFCGNFNEQLVIKLEQSLADIIRADTALIAIGSKLHPLLMNFFQHIEFIKGANVNEDIFSVVEELARKLEAYQQPASLYALYHNTPHNELILEKLLPPFKQTRYKKIINPDPPLLNISPTDFFLELTDHYLINTLKRILYVSLMNENQQRIQHLENATHHLDDKTEELQRKINALRQEEIIEEIEVILLSSKAYAMPKENRNEE